MRRQRESREAARATGRVTTGDVEAGRGRMAPRVCTSNVALFQRMVEQGCALVDDWRVLRAAVEGGRLGIHGWVLPHRVRREGTWQSSGRQS